MHVRDLSRRDHAAAALLDEVFGNRPPETRLERAVGLLAMGSYGERGGQSSGPGYGFLDRHMRDLPEVAEQTFFTVPNRAAAYVDGEKVNLFVKRTDGAFWRVFDLRFLEGAPFTDAARQSGGGSMWTVSASG